MNVAIEHGRLLMARSRFRQAQAELLRGLAMEPQNGQAHSMLAVCLWVQDLRAEALREAREGVRLAGGAYSFSVLGRVLADLSRLKEAKEALLEAIRQEPEDADHYAQMARIQLWMGQIKTAMEWVDQGLSQNPAHVGCRNIRTTILAARRRNKEALEAGHESLALDPENAWSWSLQGSNFLEASDFAAAIEHFREALRLNPMLEPAQRGLVCAMRGRYRLYRVMEGLTRRLSRRGVFSMVGLIFGGLFLIIFVQDMSERHPHLSPWLSALSYAAITFFVLSWYADVLFDLVQAASPLGRLILTPPHLRMTVWCGAMILGGTVLFLAGWLAAGKLACSLAVWLLLMVFPVRKSLAEDPGAGRAVAMSVAALIGAIGLSGICVSYMQSPQSWPSNAGVSWFVIGILTFSTLTFGVSAAVQRIAAAMRRLMSIRA